MNWVRIFNQLFNLMNEQGPTYFSGSRYINIIREFDPTFYDYGQYIAHRNQIGKSTSRKDYYYDIMLGFDEPTRLRIIQRFLEEIEPHKPTEVQALRTQLGGTVARPTVTVNNNLWNADRLNEMLETIDSAITANDLNRAVTLTYTCLEGFLKAFYRAKVGQENVPNEVVALTRAVKNWLQGQNTDLPDEVFNLLTTLTHATDRARNKYSEAHFEGDAPRWMAVYLRDLLNSQIRLLLNFL